MSHPGGSPEESRQVGHETTDADVKSVLKFLLGLGVLMVFVMILMAGFYSYLDSFYGRRDSAVPSLVDTRQVPPGPRLQADPARDMAEVFRREEHLLNSYEWIDQDTGVFRIPIDRAMEILAENGLPARQD